MVTGTVACNRERGAKDWWVVDRETAQRLIRKLRRFTTEELDDDERALLAALLAPGLDLAHAGDAEVQGYGMEPQWSVQPLADALLEHLRAAADEGG
jgi:hypothetical protein